MNIRNVEEELLRGFKVAAAAEGKTLREWVLGKCLGGEHGLRETGGDEPAAEVPGVRGGGKYSLKQL